ncbi:MAG: hypothetical protein GC159_14710 [Phycisphaera sp.]|nr:hypothetical protein [Phycisphaera sp.]
MAKKKKVESGKVDLNLTSMMDVVFQLIVFFLLITNFQSMDLPELEPPTPDKSVAYTPEKARPRLIVNVVADENIETIPKYIQVGSNKLPPGALVDLTTILKTQKGIDENTEIDLRADNKIEYQHVQKIMTAITQAEISRINLVALVDPDKRD